MVKHPKQTWFVLVSLSRRQSSWPLAASDQPGLIAGMMRLDDQCRVQFRCLPRPPAGWQVNWCHNLVPLKPETARTPPRQRLMRRKTGYVGGTPYKPGMVRVAWEQDGSILRGTGPAGRETIPPAQEHRSSERAGSPCQGFAGLPHPVPAHGFKIAGLLWVTSSYQVQFRCLNWPAHPSRCPHKTARPGPRQARLSCIQSRSSLD